MENNFKFKTRHVSIVQQSSSVVNSFTSLVELIAAMAYKLKHDTTQNSKKLTYNFMKRETLNKTCVSTTLNTKKKIIFVSNKFLQWLKYKIITMIKTRNVLKKLK